MIQADLITLYLDSGTPDKNTICRFRADAEAVLEAAFEEINRQLDATGLQSHARARCWTRRCWLQTCANRCTSKGRLLRVRASRVRT